MVVDVLAFSYPSGRPLLDYVVRDDGAGPFIASWNADALGPQPKADAIDAIGASPEFQAWMAERTPAAEAKTEAKSLTPRERALAVMILEELNVSNPGYAVPTLEQIEAKHAKVIDDGKAETAAIAAFAEGR